MKILYCRIGWMKHYKGCTEDDPISGGGSFNDYNDGMESYNFYKSDSYYGYVQPVRHSNTINIDRISDDCKYSNYTDNVLVIWVAKNPEGGQFIVGWNKDARVYRYMQEMERESQFGNRPDEFSYYYIVSDDAVVLSEKERTKQIKSGKNGMGQSNVWYGEKNTNRDVIEYITSFETNRKNKIQEHMLSEIENSDRLTGQEKEILTKIRLNQSVFRKQLLDKYSKCCLCGVDCEEILIASHIKPWSASTPSEKVNSSNGLLLCPNHDKLFDKGYISFDDDGHILISKKLNENNRMFLNVHPNMKISITKNNLDFIRYHRNHIFDMK